MAYGITDQGFIKKTYEVILAEMETAARLPAPDGFGTDIDLSAFSPIGVLIKIEAGKHAEKWELLESLYYQNQIDNATGVNLDRVANLRNIKRKAAIKSIVTLTFTGADTTVIPSGTICQTAQGIQFETTEAGVISGTTGDVQARALIAGSAGNVSAGSITVISTPIAGISAVTNAASSLNGRGIETDAELRARYKSVTGDAGASAPLIQQEFNDVESIISCTVIENNTDNTIGDLTPHSIKAVIEGGTDAEILEIFLKYKFSGIQTIGANMIQGNDDQGVLRTYYYARPANIDIYVIIDIQHDPIIPLADFSATYGDAIKEAIIKYIGGTYNSIVYSGLNTGDDVEAWRVGNSLAEIPYIIGEVDTLLGTSAPATLTRIDMDIAERPRTDAAKITVNIT